MKDIKEKEITEFYVPLLGKSKAIRETLERGENVAFGDLLRKEMKEITPDIFHGMNLISLETGKY